MEELNYVSKRGTPLSELCFKFGLLLLFLQSLNAWFTWSLNPAYIPAISIMLCLPYFFQVRATYKLLSAKFIVPSLILILAKSVSIGYANFNTYVGQFLPLIPIIFLIPLAANIKLKSLEFFTNAMAIILVPSLLIWILLLTGFSVPSLGRISNASWEYYVYDNYFFCLRGNLYLRRFNSIFLEPGHLGMIASFLLFANKFDIKRKSVIVLLITVIFTVSLAAVVLTIISFSLYVLIYSKRSLVYLGVSLVVAISGYFFFANFNGGNNIVNKAIISRLKYDDSQGDIEGDNRVTKKLNVYYNGYINNDDSWFGIGSERFTKMHFGPSAGYKVFVIENGLVGTLVIGLFYLSLVLYNKSTLSWALLVIYIFAFLQRAYPFWSCELLIFITALPLGFIKSHEEKN
jgi:hypothetical protein